MKKLYALPTWAITNIITPFLPREHPWRMRWFELADWAEKQTDLCRSFDFVFWGILVILLLLFGKRLI